MFYIIGSGPSGISLAFALLSSGFKVTMLDYGNNLSIEKQRYVDEISKLSRDKWNEDLLSNIKNPIVNNIPLKLLYGDNFSFANALEFNKIKCNNCDLLPSLAVGGLSNVWGSAVMPYNQKDILKWPVTIKDLEPHYKVLHEFMNISANYDDLTNNYPIYGKVTTPKTSRQASIFLNKLSQKSNILHSRGIVFGTARNAYNSNLCVECGLCMSGCPFYLIYNSKFNLKELQKNPNFKYINKILVIRFEEHESQVKVFCKNSSGNEIVFIGDKLFLATGVLPTAKIVSLSLDYRKPIYLADSPYFLFPVITLDSARRFKEQSNTLSQIFMEIEDKNISMNSIHLQLYFYNDMLQELLKLKLGIFHKILKPFTSYLLNRMLIVQGFLHSNDGNKIQMQLDSNDQLMVSGYNHLINDKVKLIRKKFKGLGFTINHEIALSGRGFHSGGSFPMTKLTENKIDNIVTDLDGRINKCKNVHIVDASILPTIPGQTITYTVMANAHRIGKIF